MRNYSRNRKKNSESPIKAIRVCSDIQNHIISIKRFSSHEGISKEHVNNLRTEILKIGGDVYIELRKAESTVIIEEKLAILENTKYKVLYWIELINQTGDIHAIDGKTAMYLARQLNALKDAIQKWIKYINKNKSV